MPSSSLPSPQLTFVFRARGGFRSGAGRKAQGSRPRVPHLPRERFSARDPVLVTLRAVDGLPNLRSRQCFRVVRDALGATRSALGVRIVHFSVQTHHVHLIVEAAHRAALGRGFRAIGIRLAKRLNGALGRRGAVLADRFHSRALRSPLEVKRALAYVLGNARRHAAQRDAPHPPGWVDGCSSAPWFDGFTRAEPQVWALGLADVDFALGPPVVAASVWLLRFGWRRHGLIDPDATPGKLPHPRRGTSRAARGAT